MKIEEAVNHLKANSRKRNFIQKFDLVVNLKNIDLKKPENKFSKDVVLPHEIRKDISVGIISDNAPNATNKTDLEEMGRDKKKLKAFVKKNEFFICEAPLMALVGKVLGRYLGPKGKMPKLLLPGKDPKEMIEELKSSVRVIVRDSPVIYLMVGSENFETSQIKDNVEKVVEEIKKSLPVKAKIKDVYLKLTMSKPVKIDV
ncbi:MAG: 50S ribosomal protein L1 [Candidatus Aenigmatarchaeota archaeon]